MTERFTADLMFILVALIIAALLGLLIGWFYRRIRIEKLIALENENTQLKAKLENCMKQKDMQKSSFFDAAAAREVFKAKIVENDLKIVEGIGEKIEGLLKQRGIETWYQLSQTSPEKIKDILVADGGSKYSMHEPKTWPSQAQLASEGKWKELKEYQDQLNAGK